MTAVRIHGRRKKSKEKAHTCVGLESDQGEEDGTAATQKYSGHLNIKLDENNTSIEVSQNGRYKVEPKKHKTEGTHNWHTLTCEGKGWFPERRGLPITRAGCRRTFPRRLAKDLASLSPTLEQTVRVTATPATLMVATPQELWRLRLLQARRGFWTHWFPGIRSTAESGLHNGCT